MTYDLFVRVHSTFMPIKLLQCCEKFEIIVYKIRLKAIGEMNICLNGCKLNSCSSLKYLGVLFELLTSSSSFLYKKHSYIETKLYLTLQFHFFLVAVKSTTLLLNNGVHGN